MTSTAEVFIYDVRTFVPKRIFGMPNFPGLYIFMKSE